MRYYIATTLDNVEEHKKLKATLDLAGDYELTYDWTTHGSILGAREKRFVEVAALEANGVIAADVLVVILPGGRGTHTEFGMAVACGKPVIVVGPAEDLNRRGNPCVFYWLKNVTRIVKKPGWRENVLNAIDLIALNSDPRSNR